MSKNNKILNDWLAEYGQFLADETYKLIEAVGETNKATDRLSLKVLEQLVKKIVANAMSEVKDPADRTYEQLHRAFQEVKSKSEVEIARGVEKAIHQVTGISVEYYCQIKPTPPVASKEIN